MNTSHLNALKLNLSNEKSRLASSSQAERELRAVYVSQLEKEIAGELAFLGLPAELSAPISDDELLAELLA